MNGDVASDLNLPASKTLFQIHEGLTGVGRNVTVHDSVLAVDGPQESDRPAPDRWVSALPDDEPHRRRQSRVEREGRRGALHGLQHDYLVGYVQRTR